MREVWCAIEGCPRPAELELRRDGERVDVCRRCAEELTALWPERWTIVGPRDREAVQ